LACAVEAAHTHVDVPAQDGRELGHVDAGAAVDVRRVLPGQQVDSHRRHVNAPGRIGPDHHGTSVWPVRPGRPRVGAMASPRVLAIVLAGGEGKRLMPLTTERAKPAVPFGGMYRLVDFALSNLANSGYLHIVVLTQYKSHSLDRHVTKTWRMSALLGNYVAPVPRS